MNPIVATLDSLEVGTPVTAANLSMFPLLLPQDVTPAYQTLDQALAGGVASVTEVTEGGSVPELLVKNDGTLPLLILDGEELVGAKQNRIVNLTILVPARETLHIPVSCVEAGRWARRSLEFAAAGRVHYATGRASKLHHVSDSLHNAGRRDADQSEVWRDIDAKAVRMQASSNTHAAAAMYEKAQAQLSEFQERLVAVPRQAGALFAINGVVAGLDLFDSQATWRRSMPKLVQSYGLDALDHANGPVSDAGPQPERFLAAVKTAPCEQFRAIGLGEDVRISGDHIAGAALTQDSTVIHLVAFPAA